MKHIACLALSFTLVACGGSDDSDETVNGTPDASTTGDSSVIPAADGACPGTLVNCSGACRNLSTDQAACGSCGRSCNAAEKCVSGVCACSTGTTCNDRCVDITSDPRNCNGCGNTCGAGTPACIAGKCECPSTAKLCGGSCLDIQNDFDNCGDCGKQCGNAEACLAGKCECRPGTTRCGTECIDTSGSGANCGTCGKACASGELCIAGVCTKATSCSGGLTLCGGGCVNTRTSAANCGGCGNRCDVDELCVEGRCQGYDPAPFCTTCPCPRCGDRRCCPPLASGGAATCVEGDRCP
jgi:hypothetical protein